MTKTELSQLYYLNREIEQQRRRLAELESASAGCTAKITGMPHNSGVSDKIGNYAAEIADLRSLIELNMQKCWYELNRLNRYINTVEDSRMRMILSLRYVNGLGWLQIANSIGGNTADSVRKAHDRYLQKE